MMNKPKSPSIILCCSELANYLLDYHGGEFAGEGTASFRGASLLLLHSSRHSEIGGYLKTREKRGTISSPEELKIEERMTGHSSRLKGPQDSEKRPHCNTGWLVLVANSRQKGKTHAPTVSGTDKRAEPFRLHFYARRS